MALVMETPYWFHYMVLTSCCNPDLQGGSDSSMVHGEMARRILQTEEETPLLKEEPSTDPATTWMEAYPDIDNTTIPTPDTF
jgi:hypothetical protein